MRLSKEQCACAMCMLDGGADKNVVARHFGVHRSTISCLVKKVRQTAQTNMLNDCQRAGCPCVTTLRQDHAIRLMHLRDHFKTASQQHKQ